MKKLLMIVAVLAIVIAGFVFAGLANQGQNNSPGAAPNSGDGIPDGSGFVSFDGKGPAYGPGPAPNSHDGIPDGSGW